MEQDQTRGKSSINELAKRKGAKNLSTITIEISELRSKDEAKINELAEFLKDKTNAKIDIATGEITLNYEGKKEAPSKKYLRVLLRKFLHKTELKEEFRVISGREKVFILKERKRTRVEEE